MNKFFLGIIILIFLAGCTAVQQADEELPTKEELEKTLPEPIPEPLVEEPIIEPTETPEPEELIISPETQENIDDAYSRLHDPGSATRVQNAFSDLEIVFIDEAEGSKFFPKEILPFKYYYSPSADKTFSLCGVDRSTFICDGKLDRLLISEDIESGRCKMAPDYAGDPRLN